MVDVAESEILLPITLPPGFDSEPCINTLERLMKLNASIIYLAHFGVTNKVQENLRLAVDKLKVWYDILTDTVPVSIAGYIEYYQGKHEVELNKRGESESNHG